MITPVDSGEDRSMLLDAARVVIKAQAASFTLMQRRVRVGAAKAGRLLELLEDAGVIRRTGSGPYEVLVPKSRLDEAIATLSAEPAANTRGDQHDQ